MYIHSKWARGVNYHSIIEPLEITTRSFAETTKTMDMFIIRSAQKLMFIPTYASQTKSFKGYMMTYESTISKGPSFDSPYMYKTHIEEAEELAIFGPKKTTHNILNSSSLSSPWPSSKLTTIGGKTSAEVGCPFIQNQLPT